MNRKHCKIVVAVSLAAGSLALVPSASRLVFAQDLAPHTSICNLIDQRCDDAGSSGTGAQRIDRTSRGRLRLMDADPTPTPACEPNSTDPECPYPGGGGAGGHTGG